MWNVSYLLILCGFLIGLFFLIFRKQDNGTVKFFKFLILLVPIIIIGYVFYANFVAAHEFNYFYDIGSVADSSKPYLSPLNRISDADLNESYRNLTSQLVYFSVPIPRGSDDVDVKIRFSDGFPETGSLLLGGQNKVEWSYSSNAVYNPILNELGGYDYTGIEHRIYRINSQMPIVQNLSEIPVNSIVAENIGLIPIVKNQNYNLTNLTISTGLRDAHTFYLYLNDSLDLQVKKQDINWYNGSDELNIGLFDTQGNLIANTTIEDDGIVNASSKVVAKVQEGSLKVESLSDGVYVLKFSSYDGIIREMKLNTNKIVTNKLFLADSEVYLNKSNKQTSLFIKSNKSSDIKFVTYHNQGFQNVSINNGGFSINNVSQEFVYSVVAGDYNLKIPTNDLIVSSNSYISFSEDSYFEPFKFKLVSIPTNKSEMSKIDYLVTDYANVKSENGWAIGDASFELKDLYIRDGKLSMLINTPHLANEEFQNNTIAIDWVNITVHKNGIFKVGN